MHKWMVVCIAALAAYGAALAEEVSECTGGLFEALRSHKSSERVNAMSEIQGKRRALIRGLMDIARSEGEGEEDQRRRWDTPKYTAIFLLGELRAKEAVGLLARNIAWRAEHPYLGLKSRTIPGQFPAAESLVKIGSPAVHEVLGILHTTTDPLERRVAVWTLIKIEGKKNRRDVARFRVERAIERCRLSGMRDNLKAGLKYFDRSDLELEILPPEPAKSAPDTEK